MANDAGMIEVAARAARGDRVAKATLYYAYASRLQAYVHGKLFAHVRGAWSTADVASEVLARAFAAIDGFRGATDDDFEKWLFTIARNYVLGINRKGGKNPPKRIVRPPGAISTIGTILGILSADQPSPSALARRQEVESILEAAIASLPENQRAVIFMRFYEEKAWDEIAGRMGSTVEAVRSLARRGIANLKEAAAGLTTRRHPVA